MKTAAKRLCGINKTQSKCPAGKEELYGS